MTEGEEASAPTQNSDTDPQKVIGVGPPIPISAPHSENHKEHVCEKKRKPKKFRRKRWQLALNIIIAGAALLAAGFTWWQAHIAKDTEQRQLRAYAMVTFGTFTVILPDRQPEALLAIRDEGVTPIRDAHVKYGFSVQDKIPANDYTVPPDNFTTSEATLNMRIGGDPIPLRLRGRYTLSQFDFENLIQHGYVIVLQGVLVYRDIFGHEHESSFCVASDWDQISKYKELVDTQRQITGVAPAILCKRWREET